MALLDQHNGEHVVIEVVGKRPKYRPYIRVGYVGGEYIASLDNARAMRALAHQILRSLGDRVQLGEKTESILESLQNKFEQVTGENGRLHAEVSRLNDGLRQIALYKGHKPAKDFDHCVQIARYALYPEGVKFRSKEFYELVDATVSGSPAPSEN